MEQRKGDSYHFIRLLWYELQAIFAEGELYGRGENYANSMVNRSGI